MFFSAIQNSVKAALRQLRCGWPLSRTAAGEQQVALLPIFLFNRVGWCAVSRDRAQCGVVWHGADAH